MALPKRIIQTIRNVKRVSHKEKPGNQKPMFVLKIAPFKKPLVLSIPAQEAVTKNVPTALTLQPVWPVNAHGIRMKNYLGVEIKLTIRNGYPTGCELIIPTLTTIIFCLVR